MTSLSMMLANMFTLLHVVVTFAGGWVGLGHPLLARITGLYRLIAEVCL